MHIKITDRLGPSITKGMIGLFFEDINYGLDGGLHAEMIENRSFEFFESKGWKGHYETSYDGLYGWSAYPLAAEGAILEIETADPVHPVNPHYLKFTAAAEQRGFSNKAYDGVFMKPELSYRLSFYAKAEDYTGGIEVLVAAGEQVVAQAAVASSVGKDWIKYEVTLTVRQPVARGELVLRLTEPGSVCFDFISMIPSDAVLGLFRKDLVQHLNDMKPGFVRFPGGCVVEGNTLDNRYQWKHTVGPAEGRKPNWNRWAVHGNGEGNMEPGPYSHYNQTLGIGYYEYFLLCEYLGAKPLPVLSVALACQYQSTEQVEITDPEFNEYLQDALDLIEFANGSEDTKWGAIRSAMGHPQPFGLEMIGIGNEQWETERADFFRRYELFQQAIHAKHPQIQLIGSAGPDVTSERYTAAWAFYREQAANNPDFVYAIDEHYYVKPDWLYKNVSFYDQYPRTIKVFAGEYAAHYGNGMNAPHFNKWGAALAEAAFLTGLERNADVVAMASYAPLFARLGYAQWSPDLIWFDGDRSYGSPSYYVQKLYGTLTGTDLVQVECGEDTIPHTVSYDRDTKTLYVKLVNHLDHSVQVQLDNGFSVAGEGQLYIMQGQEDDVNSIDHPQRIAPVQSSIAVNKTMELEVKGNSFYVIRMMVE